MFINGITFQDIADFVFDLAGDTNTQNIFCSDGIIWCKPECLRRLFATIKNSERQYTLITHASDFCITHEYFNLKPPQIKKWFAQNVNFCHPDLIPLPIGFENDKGPYKGSYTDFEFLKKLMLKNDLGENIKRDMIYVNFSVSTHYNRSAVMNNLMKDLCFVQDRKLSYCDYMREMSTYKYVASPRGNGIDCHRTWEALLCGCIPLVDNTVLSRYFSLSSPMILVDDWSTISRQFLYDECKKLECMTFSREVESLNFWKRKITIE